MSKMNRRKFLGGALAGAGASLFPQTTWSSIRGANEDVRVAFLGVGGKGSAHTRDFAKLKGVRLVAVCDADMDHATRARDELAGKFKVDAYQDYRNVLERKDVDAVVIATPNHWHTPMAVHAAQAGKDIYVEKPVTHNIWEGQRLIDAAKKYNVIIQSGMQRRSDQGWLEAMDYLRGGELGKVVCSRGLCYKRRKSIGLVEKPQAVPESVDYNLWSGPAQLNPVMREQFHYDWHWFWDYGNGDLGNQGVHQTDVARWALNADSLPKRVVSVGGRFGYVDNGETANTQFAIFEYDEGQMIFEVRGLPRDSSQDEVPYYKVDDKHPAGVQVGNVIHCENGYIAEAGAYDKDGKRIKKFRFDGGGEHQANFIKAVRSRKQEDIAVNARDGHLSAAICHLANISHRLGSETAPEVIAEHFKGDALAMETLEKFKEHLAANGVDLKKTHAVLGPVLEMDREKEIFTGAHAEEANKHVSRDYRQEFGLSENV